ncbi:pol [Symbiodinium sp. CCMP2592]|nr:pol [Symbiodinium sp. CCMP2592]
MGKKVLQAGNFVGVGAVVGYVICLFLPLHKAYYTTLGGLVRVVDVTTYSLAAYYHWHSSTACWFARKLRGGGEEECNDDGHASVWLQDTQASLCTEVSDAIIMSACSGYGTAYTIGLCMFLIVLLNAIAQGITFWLIQQYMHKPKKQYREVAFFLDLIGCILMLICVITYILAIQRLSAITTPGDILISTSDGIGASYGYTFLYFFILVHVSDYSGSGAGELQPRAMNGPPGTFMGAWQGKGFGLGVPGLPPGPVAFATGTAAFGHSGPSDVGLLLFLAPAWLAVWQMFWELPGYPGVRRLEITPKGCKVPLSCWAERPPLMEVLLDTSDAIVKALTMAVSGERKMVPSWSGSTSTLRAWLRQLSFWELDNQIPRKRWGVKLFQAFPEGSIPRRITESLPMEVILSESGYGAILTSVLEKFKPYLEAAAPAAVDAFCFQGERSRNETFANFIAAKELAMQEVESMVGEKVPDKTAGRILLRQSNLTEAQRETMAIKHNALLGFEEVARALRPLDRPEALLKPMAATNMLATAEQSMNYWINEEDSQELPEDQGQLDGLPEEWTDYQEAASYYEEPECDERGEPLLFYEADREYDEEEALYIWAYNDAYHQMFEELQARRKGRQFYKPAEQKGKSKGKSKNRKGRGHNRGTADDLLARTRCYSCGELGHFSRDCPGNQQVQPADGRTNFVVSQGQGALNRTFVASASSVTSRAICVFAGVRTGAGQGLVDTAAEEAVIGSEAFSRLRETLQRQGSAQILNIWDVPIGVCQTNGLLRITEVKDTEGFETPLLLPVSYQELVGMVIDFEKEEVRNRQGRATPMQRLPSGHRAVSVVEFNGQWQLPRELQQHGRDPFQLPRQPKVAVKTGPVQKHRGVTVWLQLCSLAGPRSNMVLPSECVPLELQPHLEPTRVTFLDALPGHMPYVINDVWHGNLGSRRLDAPWTGTVVFQQVSATCFIFELSDAAWIQPGELAAQTRQGRRRRGSDWCQKAWSRLVRIIIRMIATTRDQMVIDALDRGAGLELSVVGCCTPAKTVSWQGARGMSAPGGPAAYERRPWWFLDGEPYQNKFGPVGTTGATQFEDENAENMANPSEHVDKSGSTRALAVQPGSQIKDFERVDARAVMRSSPREWADYQQPSDLRTEGPMAARRSRSLPAGVVPTQERSRRRQVQLREGPAEMYAINDRRLVKTEPSLEHTTFTMLESAPLAVRQSMARRGYNLFCGLAILLSTFGQTPPLAASLNAKLPFDRLEAGYEPGGGSDGFHFVLFRLPGREYSDVFLGSFFCSSVCNLPRPMKIFVMAELGKSSGDQQDNEKSRPKETIQPVSKTAFGSSTTVSPVVTLIQDGGLSDEGPYGGRVLSFLYAWDFRQRHAAVEIPLLQQPGNKKHMGASTVSMQLQVGGPRLHVVVNDKTLVRIFEDVDWRSCTWATADPEDLDLCVRSLLQCLCFSKFCDGVNMPQIPDVKAAADKHRAAFDGLVLAVRTQTAATILASVASYHPGGDECNLAWSTSRPNSFSAAQSSEEPMDMDQSDEAVREVQASLRPVTENAKVAEAMENVDDFRKHEETGRFSLHPHLRRELFKVHRNLNHPAKDVFLRALRHSGVRDDVLQWVKEFFTCPLCEASKRSLPARPAHLAKALEFNAIVAVDLFYMNLFGAEQIFLVCIDYGTGYLQVARCADAKAITVRQALSKFWVAPFGVPELLICDQGPEFAGEQFVEFMSQMGAAIHFTDGMSPWKNGRAERAVGTVKQKLKTVLHETAATAEELDLVIAQVVSAHNSLFDRHGYSPNQRLFGRSLRLPGSLMATDRWDQEMLQAAAGDLVQRTWAIRDASRAAWLKEDDVTSVRRAAAAQTRRSDLHSFGFQPGQWAFVWRRTDNRFGWVGPGVLIAMTPGGNSWWINMRGRLWKVSSEQMRPASSEEELGAELIVELHRDLLDQIIQGVRTGYEDVTQEESPPSNPDELFPELFAESDSELTRPPHEPSQENHGGDDQGPAMAEVDDASEDLTTTVGDVRSERALPSEPNMSRRQSAVSVPSASPAASTSEVRRAIQVDEGSSAPMLLGPVRERVGPPVHNPYYSREGFLDEAIKPSNYIEVMQFDGPEISGMNYLNCSGPKWIKRLTSGRNHLEPQKPTVLFQATEAEASYCERDKCMYLAKAKTSFGQVEFSKLQGAERELFRKSRSKEVDSLLSNKAIRVLSIKESDEFRRQHPEHVLESRFVDRYKPTALDSVDIEQAKKAAINEGDLTPLQLTEDRSQPKSRWCVVGWADPHVHQIERSAPTPSSAAVNTVLQLCASRRWTAFVKDVKTAFLQSRPTDRKIPLACNQPRDESLPGLDPRQLILLLTEVYGLVSGPSWWRSSFLQKTGKLGYKICPYEPCILVLPADEPNQSTQGVLVIEVDDVIEGGDQHHRQQMASLEDSITFGKAINLQEKESSYAGKSLKQLPDFGFEIHMDEYIYSRMSPVSLTRKVLKKDAAQCPLDEAEKSQLRGVLATLTWVGREGRPDSAAASSILAAAFPEPTVETIYLANEVVRQLKQHPVRLRIRPIPEDAVRNVLISDAAFDTSGREKSQHGFLLGFTTPDLNLGKPAPLNLMLWRSRRLRRKAASSMLCEALSLSAATACLEKQDALWDALRLSSFNPRQRQRQEEEVLELQGRSTVISSESDLFRDPRSVVVIDAKALYDSLLNDQAGECERSNLEIAVIKESLQVCKSRPRWVPHNMNPADALTKYPGAHLEPLVRLLKTGMFQVTDEQQTLQAGKQGLNRQKLSKWEDASGNFQFQGAVEGEM